ncbi:hypothetical protein PsYK624_173150, partial [Phanerochaete sordida]
MYSHPSEKLVRDAWWDFKERLRWRVWFYMPENDTGRDYDPDYALPKDRKLFHDAKAKPQRSIPDYVEIGLQHGDRYVEEFIRNVMPVVKATSRSLNLVWLDDLKDYLSAHNYIVTSTDKNLGVCVLQADWANQQTHKLWNDPLNYRPISALEADTLMKEKHKSVFLAAKLANELGQEDLAAFLKSKIRGDDWRESDSTLGEFYGIPKRQPHIIQGSKHLVEQLSNLNLDPHRKAWIVSGDIVAFYPNIPLDRCIAIVTQMWLASDEAKELDVKQVRLFRTCFNVANRGLIIKFGTEYAEQIRGLAMGIACSPDLAQLYGSYFENPILASPDMKQRFAYFGRYLDDVLGIVYASSAEEAMSFARKIEYEGVEVEWSV